MSRCKPSFTIKAQDEYTNRKLIRTQGFEGERGKQYGIELICLLICLLSYSLGRKLAKSDKTLPLGISGNIPKGKKDP